MQSVVEDEDEDEDEDERRAIRNAVASLPDPSRQVVELRFFDQLEYPEIALALGRGEKTVRSQIDRALVKLRSLLPRDQGDFGTPGLILLLQQQPSVYESASYSHLVANLFQRPAPPMTERQSAQPSK